MQLYKPTPSNKGHACSIQVKDKVVFISLIKQASWDAAKKVGSFSANRENPSATVNIKFNATEISGFIDAIENNREYSFYHSTANSVSRGNFKLYFPKEGDGFAANPKGFSLSLTKEANNEKVNFAIGLTFPEAVQFREYLKYALTKIFQAEEIYVKKEKAPVNPVKQAEEEWTAPE